MTISDIDIMARVVLSDDECRFLAQILEESDDSGDEVRSEKIWSMASLFRAAAALTETSNKMRPGVAQDAFRGALKKSGLLDLKYRSTR
jgi:hypothetical protein